MKLFFDENVGYRVPEALRLVRVDNVEYLTQRFGVDGRPAQGVKDQDWIPVISDSHLVISRDTRLLRRPHQKQLLADHRVGIVCITAAYASPIEMLAFMLRRLEGLRKLDALPRPFAFRTTLRGPFNRVELPE